MPDGASQSRHRRAARCSAQDVPNEGIEDRSSERKMGSPTPIPGDFQELLLRRALDARSSSRVFSGASVSAPFLKESGPPSARSSGPHRQTYWRHTFLAPFYETRAAEGAWRLIAPVLHALHSSGPKNRAFVTSLHDDYLPGDSQVKVRWRTDCTKSYVSCKIYNVYSN